VTLRSNTIHYLDPEVIQNYANVVLISKHGERLRCNSLILAACKSALVYSFNPDDETHYIITEFSEIELQNVLNFCKTGEYQGIEDLLKAFGFFNEPEEEVNNYHHHGRHHHDRYHHHEPKVDLKVKDEPLDSYDEEDEDYDPNRPEYDDEDDYDYDYATPKAKKFKPKVEFEDDYDEYDDDYWTPKKRIKTEDGGWITPKKEGGGRGSLGEEESRLYENFTWPQPLESYRMPPQTMKFKENPERDADKEYQCHLCQRKCSSSQNLKGHVIKYHQEHYNCPKCFKSFPLDESENFRLHLFKHEYLLTPRPNKCITCGKVFKINKILQTHLKKAGPYHNNECVQCDFTFTSHDEYVGHVLQVHFGKWVYRCGHCKAPFESEIEVKRHFRQVHSDKPPPPPKSPSTSPPKKPKKKVCEECGVATYALKNHILAFHSDKIFKCDECGKIYNSPYLLKGHINNVHIKVPCSMCGEMVSKGKFNYHMQQKHVPASEKKHKCDYCGKGFSETSRLRDHINVHTGEKPHKCRFCNTGFASIGNKAAHERSHLGLKRKSSGSTPAKNPFPPLTLPHNLS